MRGRSTIILLVLAAGLFAYLYFVDAKKPVADDKAKEKVFTADSTKIEPATRPGSDSAKSTTSAGSTVANT